MEVYQWLMILYFSLLFLVGTAGNIFLLGVFWRNKNHSSVIVFIKALAITDLYISLTKPIMVIYWIVQDHGIDSGFCTIFQFTVGTGYTLTFCMIFGVAVDRYLAIYHTHKSDFSVTVQHAIIFVLVVWISCHLGTFIKVLFSDDLQVYLDKYFCAEQTDTSVYVTYSLLAFVFILCCIVVIWINFQIIQALKRQSQTLPESQMPHPASKAGSDGNELYPKNGGKDLHPKKDRKEPPSKSDDKNSHPSVIDLETTPEVHVQETELSAPKMTAKRSSSKISPTSRRQSRKTKRAKVFTSLTKMLAVVSLIYVATALPSVIIFFIPLEVEFYIAFQSPFLYALYLLMKYSFFLVSIIKPFVYYAVSRTFREQCRDFGKQLCL